MVEETAGGYPEDVRQALRCSFGTPEAASRLGQREDWVRETLVRLDTTEPIGLPTLVVLGVLGSSVSDSLSADTARGLLAEVRRSLAGGLSEAEDPHVVVAGTRAHVAPAAQALASSGAGDDFIEAWPLRVLVDGVVRSLGAGGGPGHGAAPEATD